MTVVCASNERLLLLHPEFCFVGIRIILQCGRRERLAGVSARNDIMCVWGEWGGGWW